MALGREESKVNGNGQSVCGEKKNTENLSKIQKFLGRIGLTVRRKHAEEKGNEKEERNKGGDGCIKSQSCLLVPLPFALPQRMV